MYAVVYTDALQSIAMIIGVIICTVGAVIKTGGMSTMFQALQNPGGNQTSWLVDGTA